MEHTGKNVRVFVDGREVFGTVGPFNSIRGAYVINYELNGETDFIIKPQGEVATALRNNLAVLG